MANNHKREAWHPPPYEKADIRAIQALANGTATAQDQQRALDWIVNTAAATYDEPFRPGSRDVVDYMLGRRSVGLAIVKLLKLKPEIFGTE
jgi:hypothetical protein